MTIAELHNINFNDAAEELSAEFDTITTYETLIAFAKHNIEEGRLFLSIHILSALNESPADYYDYDYSMGTLDTPTPLWFISDLEDYCEQEGEDETV